MLENPFMQYNHIEIVSVTSASAVMSLDIRRAVSYTHLDVYKRQSQMMNSGSMANARPMPMRWRRPPSSS